MMMSKTYIQMRKDFKVLSIDPGYERLGIAIIEKDQGMEKLIYSDCFHTKKELPHNERLFLIGEEIKRVIKKHHPSVLAIETLIFNSNQKTATKVSEVRGLIIYIASSFKMKVCEYSPLQIKQAVTGYGRSSKKQIENFIPHLIKLPKKKMKDDELDAIATGLTCTASLKIRNSGEM